MTVIICSSAFIATARADWQEQDKLLASDGFGGAHFGQSVSISGDYAIVGACWGNGNVAHTGSAYIFKRSDVPDDPNWYQQAKLIASDGAYYDYFGISVSLSGDYAIVGATGDDDNGHDSGSAYIFKRDGTVWIEQAKLLPSDAAAGDRFGECVSISGGYVVVGAFYDDDNGADSGSAYIFTPNSIDPNNWDQQAKLLASDGAAGDWFGVSVSISGDYAIVSAPYNDANGSDSGSAYIFKRSDVPDDPNWYQQAKLTASDGAAGDLFSRSVSISGDYCIVGAYGDDDNGSSSGSAYIFTPNSIDPNNWDQQAKLTASDGAAGDAFGISASIKGDYAIVGAHGDDGNVIDSGSAYIFKRRGASWIEVDKLTASDDIAEDLFGISVSISGDYTIAGARHYYPSSYPGSAYIFKRVCPTADISGDCRVDFRDFAIMAGQWLQDN